jgi:hypothetical protein
MVRVCALLVSLCACDVCVLRAVVARRTFDGVGAFLRGAELSADDVRKAVLSTIGAIDAPLSPDTKGCVV